MVAKWKRMRIAALVAIASLGLECSAFDLPAVQVNRAGADQRAAAAAFHTAVAPFFAKHCNACHGAVKPKGGLNLTLLQDGTAARAQRKTWERVREYVEGGVMPPDDRPQPDRAEVGALIEWIKSAVKPDDCGRTFDPGRVTIRRLNRAEYNNTIRDLLGVDFHPADDFPSDDVGYGFDNIGDVLTLPPILMEKYLAAGESVSEEAILVEPAARGVVKSYDSVVLGSGAGAWIRGDGAVGVGSTGEVGVLHTFPRNGHYILRVPRLGRPGRA